MFIRREGTTIDYSKQTMCDLCLTLNIARCEVCPICVALYDLLMSVMQPDGHVPKLLHVRFKSMFIS